MSNINSSSRLSTRSQRARKGGREREREEERELAANTMENSTERLTVFRHWRSLTSNFHRDGRLRAPCEHRISYDSPPSRREMSRAFWQNSVAASLYQYCLILPRDASRARFQRAGARSRRRRTRSFPRGMIYGASQVRLPVRDPFGTQASG